MLFRFYCDESYDGSPAGNTVGSHEPRTYVVAGFFSDQATWNTVESEWMRINNKYGVSRFHASHLNSRFHEYEGWDDVKKISYSTDLLKSLNEQGKKMYAFSVGILADDYRTIISDAGREKWGHPYMVCFKACIAWIAREMSGDFPPEDQFAVVLDRNKFQSLAVDTFHQLMDEEGFAYRSRLSTCTPANSEEVVALQAADLIAYEVYKRLHDTRSKPKEMRTVLKLMLTHNVVEEGYFGEEVFLRDKLKVESSTCGPNKLVVIPLMPNNGA